MLVEARRAISYLHQPTGPATESSDARNNPEARMALG